MRSSRKVSSSSPSPSSSPPRSSSRDSKREQTGPRLTRQPKLRHVTDWYIGLPPPNTRESHSSAPVSPNERSPSSPPACSHDWPSPPVPQPLPLPESSSRRQGFPAAVKLREEEGVGKEALIDDPEALGNTFFQPRTAKNKDYVAGGSARLPSSCHKGFRHDQNGEHAYFNLRLKVPTWSAPTTAFSSPAVSPRRLYKKDFDPSLHMNSHDFQFRSGMEALAIDRCAGSLPQSLPVQMGLSHDHSPVLSPTAQSPRMDHKSSGGVTFQMHQRLLPEASIARPESSSHVNAYPLPLPPGALTSPLSAITSHAMEKPNISSMKNQWQKGRLIGCGSFGSVYFATNCETGASCAMKEVDIIPDDPKSAECIKQLEQEIKVLRHLEHQNIVQYYGCEIVDDHFYIYMEYVHPGSINKFVREHYGTMTESVVRNFTRHILLGLAYLHSTKTVHRDIKGANLLVDAKGVVKLADFGMAKHLKGHADVLSMKGSPYWMAPELMQASMWKDGNPELAFAVDIWSLGCTVIEMLNGKPPWSELPWFAAMFKVLNKSPPIPDKLSSELKDFLKLCFQRNPAERPSAVMLLEHPFLRNSHDQTLTTPMQTFPGKTSVDNSQSARERIIHQFDFAPSSLHTRSSNSNGHVLCVSDAGTSYSAVASDHPRTHFQLNVPHSLSQPQSNYSSQDCILPRSMLQGVLTHHSYATPRSHVREILHL